MSSIAEFIKKYRKSRGMTQGEFGALLGVSAQAVSKWERQICCPDILLLPDIARILEVSVDDMLA